MFSWFGKSDAPEGGSPEKPTDSSNELYNSNNNHHHHTTTSTSSSTLPRTWQAALDETCLQQGTLHASVGAVTQRFAVAEIPSSDQALLWDVPTVRQAVLVERLQATLRGDSVTTTTTTTKIPPSPPSRTYTLLKGVAKGAVATIGSIWSTEIESDQYGKDLAQRHNADDDDSIPPPPTTNDDVPLDETTNVGNTDLALECLLWMRDKMLRQGLLTLPGGAATAAQACHQWLCQMTNNNNNAPTRIHRLLPSLPAADAACLFDVLQTAGVVEIVVRRPAQDDVLFFHAGTTTTATATTTDQEDTSKYCRRQVQLALFDLQQRRDEIHQRIDEWTARRDACHRQALHYRRTQQETHALHQMRLAKRIAQQVQAQQAVLLQLEEQHLAVENAASNAAVVQVTQQTAAVLRRLRQETADVDQVLEDLQEELDHQEDIQEGFKTTLVENTSVLVVDEDDLLAELQALTVQEGDGGAPSSSERGGGPPPRVVQQQATTVVVDATVNDNNPLFKVPATKNHPPADHPSSTETAEVVPAPPTLTPAS